jgi:hypothetical protein
MMTCMLVTIVYVALLHICGYLTDFYLLYAKLEEEHGLARHAMDVYDRATQAVLPEEQYEVNTIGCCHSNQLPLVYISFSPFNCF